MPFISTERVAEIRAELRRALPEFKFSVRRKHYSCVDVVILRGPVDMMQGAQADYVNINHFYIAEHYKDRPEIMEVLLRVKEIIATGCKTESIDSDYGHIPTFYMDLTIGDWEKPYIRTTPVNEVLNEMADKYAEQNQIAEEYELHYT